MELKWIVFVLMAWIIVSLLVGVGEHVIVGGTGAASTLTALSSGSFFARAGALGHMVSFNFPSIFYGAWAILQWIFFLPFAIAFGVMLAGYILAHMPVIGRGGS